MLFRLSLTCSCLHEVGDSGERAVDFLALFSRLIAPDYWRIYLALRGVLPKIGALITNVCTFLPFPSHETVLNRPQTHLVW